MIRFLQCVLLFSWAAGTSFGASWYLDPLASGANNGTSWADAWNNPTNIVWASVNPGDTVFVSGGSTSQIYTNSLIAPNEKSGTAANWIKICPGRDAGHNGLVIFTNCTLSLPLDNSSYWWIDGAKDDNFVAPTNYEQVLNGPTAITNNIGIRIENIVGNVESDFSPTAWYHYAAPSNIRYSYVEICGLTNDFSWNGNSPVGYDWRGSVVAINSGDSVSNIVYEYLFLHDNVTKQFFDGGSTNGFDQIVFKFSRIQYYGEDVFQVNGGWTIRDSIIGPAKAYGKSHSDNFQITGDNIKMYNLLIHSGGNSYLRLQSLAYGSPLMCLRHDIWFFNNIEVESDSDPDGGCHNEPNTVVNFDPGHPADTVTYSNIFMFNNLFIRSCTNKVVAPYTYANNAVVSWSTGEATTVTNVIMKSNIFANNLVVDRQKGVALPASTNVIPQYSVHPYTTNDFWADYNTVAATNAALTSPKALVYEDMDVLAGTNNTYKFSNNTNYPKFVNQSADNFQIASNDTVALGTGYNLSAYTTFDALNNPRPAAGAWDRGPLVYQSVPVTDTNLILWLKFDDADSFTNSIALDSSSYGNNGHRFGWTNSVWPSNSPGQFLASAVPGRTNLTAADFGASFDWVLDARADFGRVGSYFGVTNVSQMTNLATATIMCWARYNPPHAGYDYLSDHNEKLLSAGTADELPGAWEFGRSDIYNNPQRTFFIVFTNANTGNGCNFLQFPDFCQNDDSTNWNHYAVTWNNGVDVAYFNGVPVATNNISAIVTRLQIGEDMSWKAPWIGIGCDTHAGTPLIGDNEGEGYNYPNNGFLNGAMDDVRIYNRVLSVVEIQAVYSSNGGTGLPAGPAPPTFLRPVP
jgi:hypothetical protein